MKRDETRTCGKRQNQKAKRMAARESHGMHERSAEMGVDEGWYGNHDKIESGRHKRATGQVLG